MTYTEFESALTCRQLRCINIIRQGFDVYFVGRYYWGDEQIEEDGTVFQFVSNENESERYSYMINRLNTWKIKE